jgi:hypothetical protein
MQAPEPQPAPEPRTAEHKPVSHAPRRGHAPPASAPKQSAPKAQGERTSDAHQLPAFLLRPVPLPKAEKPAAAPRKKAPVTA